MAKKVLITGGSGLLGQQLTKQLQEAGYSVAWLGRSGNAPEGVQG
ncbi:MAG TPA: TIGR01777 family protein, partial [Cytophagales bacterium]|nr:TIGR01777 family protein [Cytophagales bacterium]